MIYDVDFKNKKIVGIHKKENEKEFHSITEYEDDPILNWMKTQLPQDQYEIYESSVKHYLNNIYIKDPNKWTKLFFRLK